MLRRKLAVTLSHNLLIKIMIVIPCGFTRDLASERIRSRRLVQVKMHTQIPKRIRQRFHTRFKTQTKKHTASLLLTEKAEKNGDLKTSSNIAVVA
jgi:hypothetical protein